MKRAVPYSAVAGAAGISTDANGMDAKVSAVLAKFREAGIEPAVVDRLQARLGKPVQSDYKARRIANARRNLAEVIRLTRKGMKSADIARKLELSPSYVGKLRKQAEAAARRKGKRG